MYLIIWSKLVVWILLVMLSCYFVCLIFFVGLCIVLSYLSFFEYLFHRFCWWSSHRPFLSFVLLILSMNYPFHIIFYFVVYFFFLYYYNAFYYLLAIVLKIPQLDLFFVGLLFSQPGKLRTFRLVFFWLWLAISWCFYDWN